MTYEEQIQLIKAAKDGCCICARRKGGSDEGWAYHDTRTRQRDLFSSNKDVQFNFAEYEYRISTKESK